MERIDVRRLGSGLTAFSWKEDPAKLGLDAEPGFLDPIMIEVAARKAGARVLLTGTIESLVRLECRRCLEEFGQAVRAEVKVEYREGDPPRRRLDEIRDDEPETSWYEHPFIDPAEDLRQILLVAMPDYPVCRADCRGLCPRCGANLNAAPCGHSEAGTDGRERAPGVPATKEK